jgi:tetratricopeptide (TPR) repeat protein
MLATRKIVFAATFSVVLLACSGPKQGSSGGPVGAQFHYELAVNLYYDKNAQAALKELAEAFAIDPDHADSHNLAGLIYLGRKQYPDALQHFQKALDLVPRFYNARANLGALYLAMQEWNKAIETLTPLLAESLYQTPYLVANNLGWAYYNLKDYRNAEEHYKRALFLNSDLCLAYNNLGILHAQTKRMVDASDDFDAAIKRCPEYIEAYFRSGDILERRGLHDDAAKRFEKCQKLGGESFYARRCKRKLEAFK